MITLKTLCFDNLFSYGKGNVIRFDENPITQLVGKNGHGKSSIALILEEAIYNKNSKGIKKADILNRHGKDKSYKVVLELEKDGDSYRIETVRGSTQTVILYKNGDNISAHTATNTFKIIESIMGMDHKAFSQLVYQSSAGSLEFLTATDSNRKKFLIDLLDLERYLKAFEVFKAAAKELSEELNTVEGSIKTTQAWVDKYKSFSTEKIKLKGYPVIDSSIDEELTNETAKLQNIAETNKRIIKNNQYITNLEALDISILKEHIDPPVDETKWIGELAEHRKVIKDSSALISKIDKLNGVCPTCLQVVNRALLDELISEQEQHKLSSEKALEKLLNLQKSNEDIKKKFNKQQNTKTEYEQYHSLVDQDMQKDLLDEKSIKLKISELRTLIDKVNKESAEVSDYNSKAEAHNSKVEVIESQKESMLQELKELTAKLMDIQDRLGMLQLLQKTFSTSGLIAYKIECMVKDLEDLTNKYLAELSDGRFQISFKVSASDKLNVIITDNGIDIDIVALSSGERARVNTATLLAIRGLMQALHSSRINLLILDETIENLDVDGKEKLIEVLLGEEHLNTFLVSHGFQHPLLEKITVVKEHNISRLE